MLPFINSNSKIATAKKVKSSNVNLEVLQLHYILLLELFQNFWALIDISPWQFFTKIILNQERIVNLNSNVSNFL